MRIAILSILIWTQEANILKKLRATKPLGLFQLPQQIQISLEFKKLFSFRNLDCVIMFKMSQNSQYNSPCGAENLFLLETQSESFKYLSCVCVIFVDFLRNESMWYTSNWHTTSQNISKFALCTKFICYIRKIGIVRNDITYLTSMENK